MLQRAVARGRARERAGALLRAPVDRTFAILLVGLVVKATVLAEAVVGPGWSVLLAAPAAVPLSLLLLAPGLVLHGARRTAYLVGVAAVLSSVLLADLVNVRAFGRLLSVTMIGADAPLDGLGASVVAMLRPVDALFYADVVLVLVLALRGVLARRSAPVRVRVWRALTVAVVGTALFAVQVLTMTSDPAARIVSLSPLGSHVHEAYAELVDTNRVLDPAERRRVEDWFAGNAAYQDPAPEHADLFGALAGKDVFVVQVESLEDVVVGLEVEGQEVTPVLDGLLEESIRFTDVVQQTRDGNTADAELLVHASAYPVQAGAAFMRFPENRGYASLPRLAGDHGWHTQVLHGDVASFWNRDEVYPRLGWDEYVSEEDFADTTQIGMGTADSALFHQALLELEEHAADGPSLMYLSTLTSHTPWDMPPELQGLELTETNHGAGYLQSLHYTDAAFGEFYRALEEQGRLDRSAFVFFGDHEGIHKYFPDEAPPLVPDNDKRLPLIVHVPGMDGFEVDNPGGQVDILPTLAFLMGVPPDEYADRVMGRNLLGAQSGSGVDSDGAITYGVDGLELLTQAYEVADLAVSGDFFMR
ncbi:LTA synthase family protein [Ornithinimicrobium avium]|uniref:LTA synthase family protein n=1 Tax=Ornithinimicrobium avium TaxID=2283195 RepID=A0A345NKR2_9MICO|nr:LTA synthase family protein [Ornithinimicrobium avium]AXH95620.1 LTA synthase family protein [Ornithinimicrobium avium]